jgi:DNA-binding IclR family transcriptional regulator
MDAAVGGHTANMAILDDADIIYVERCRSSKKSPTYERTSSTDPDAGARSKTIGAHTGG